MLAQDVGGFNQSELRADAAIGPDFEVEFFEVGALTQTGRADVEGNANDR